jgi:hypothetical protein
MKRAALVLMILSVLFATILVNGSKTAKAQNAPTVAQQACQAIYNAWATPELPAQAAGMVTEQLLQNSNRLIECKALYIGQDRANFQAIQDVFDNIAMKRFVDFIKRHGLKDQFKQEEDPQPAPQATE